MDEKEFAANIKQRVASMELIREIAWRVSIILLPWQTRFFVEGPFLNGFPWENGRLSFYASWIPMFATIVCACLQRPSFRLRFRFIVPLILLIFASLFTTSRRATFQWWAQVIILFTFFWSLYQLKINRDTLIKWFLVSLIPHVLLGFLQYATQHVAGSKWLGMAWQQPDDKGVSVIEVNGWRVLRAYGGFPHPNIFGGWLAVAIPLGCLFALSHVKRKSFYFWMILSGIFIGALFLTYSRAAWLACAITLVLLGVCILRKKDFNLHKRGLIIFAMLTALSGCFIFFQHSIIYTRFYAMERLEIKSISERQIGFQDGIALFQQHPFVGVGPGATRLVIRPHIIFLLVFVELGLIGVLGLILLLYPFFRGRNVRVTGYGLLVTLLIIGFFDHYPWSYWSGLTLMGCIFFFFMISSERLQLPQEEVHG